MRAALFCGVGHPFEVQEIPKPTPGPGEVLVQVMAAGLCGSDVHIAVEGTTAPAYLPMVLGHEAAGLVAEVGAGVTEWVPGERVSVLPDLVCGNCVNCWEGRSELCLKRRLIGIHRPGALAEFMVVPAANLVHLPESISFEAGAIAADAVATPYHALVRVGALHGGERVLILGLGALGLHAVSLARVLGASQVGAVTRHPRAGLRARARGADEVREWQKSPWPAGAYDLVVDFSGHPAMIERGMEALRAGGRLVLVGISEEPFATHIKVSSWVRRGIQVVGSYGANLGDLSEVLSLAERNRINLENSITHRFSLEDAFLALQHLADKWGDPIRVAILPELMDSKPSKLCRPIFA